MRHDTSKPVNFIFEENFNKDEPYDGCKALVRRLCELDCVILFLDPPKCYEKGCMKNCPTCFECAERRFQTIKNKYEKQRELIRDFYSFAGIDAWFEPISKAYSFNSLFEFNNFYKSKGFVFDRKAGPFIEYNLIRKYKNTEKIVLKIKESLSRKELSNLKLPNNCWFVLFDKNNEEITRSKEFYKFNRFASFIKSKDNRFLFNCYENENKKNVYYISLEMQEEDNDEI